MQKCEWRSILKGKILVFEEDFAKDKNENKKTQGCSQKNDKCPFFSSDDAKRACKKGRYAGQKHQYARDREK